MLRIYQRTPPVKSLTPKVEVDTGDLERMYHLCQQIRAARFETEFGFNFEKIAILIKGDKAILYRPDESATALGFVDSIKLEGGLVGLLFGAEGRVLK